MFIAVLSSLGLPGLNSFAGEFLAFLGAFRSNVVFGTLGTVLLCLPRGISSASFKA